MIIKNLSQLFAHVWAEREHVSEISGKQLLPEQSNQWHWQMAHVLSKQAYPAYKLNPDNIMLMLPEEHANQESFPAFIERREELKRQYYAESPYSYTK